MNTTEPLPLLFGRPVRTLHCIGVAGMGLGPLAIYAAGLGFTVTGGDDGPIGAMAAHLTRAGINLLPAGSLPDATELVVFSSAVPQTHPALAAARARGLPTMRRGELLAELARHRRLVAVCGSHGKTTTTAMLITALRAAGLEPGYVGGGLFGDDSLPPAAAGRDPWLVAEIDESDGTINQFTPSLCLMVNLDWDHPDHYPTENELLAAFAALIARTSGPVLLNAACPRSLALAPDHAEVTTFGQGGHYALLSDQPDGPVGLALSLGGEFLPSLPDAKVRAFGAFNALNATAALAAAALLGARLQSSLLANYPGVRRRQSILATGAGMVVIEDYAHHPAEIAALLSSLRPRVPAPGRLRVVFQPHRFSRTERFRPAFAAALAAADTVTLLDVYGAGENSLPGGTTADLVADLTATHPALPVIYLPGEHTQSFKRLSADQCPGDLVAIIGAGDLDVSARAWLATRDSSLWWDHVAAALAPAVSGATPLLREAPLAQRTTLGVGGAARLYAEPSNTEDLLGLIRAAHALGVRLLPLGRGSNLLVPDTGVDALVVSLRHPFWESFELLPDGRVRVGAGLRLKNLCGIAAKASLAGFEFLEGIPGNIGGALRMNAGAMGGWMFDVVESVELITLAGEVRTLSKAAMHVDYRHCAELENAIAIAAILQPAATMPSESVARQVDVYRDKRKKSQPRQPSAGCIFKNPIGDSAGRLIDAAGLKGTCEGDAEVSPVHANFIVNNHQASAADVITLIRRVRASVEQTHGVRLEPEVLLYGRNWKDVL